MTWSMADEWGVLECDQPLVIDWLGLWLMNGGYLSECDQLLVIDYDLAYGWWVEGIFLSVTNR
jgi:hypothetical protein